MARVFNFYAGPATLPESVLRRAQEELVDFHGMGMSLVETSHRSKEYDQVHNGAISLIRELMGVPDDFQVLFLGGGATLQFGMIPMNFLGGGTADYVVSGAWAKKAVADAKLYGTVRPVFDGSQDKFTSLPDPAAVKIGADSAYFHLTSNETIEGLQWKDFPASPVPMIADMSSDILSRPVPVDRFAMIYAGAQKNLGPAGVTIVIIRKDLIDKGADNLPAYLSYRTHADKNSLYNTPPVFSVYLVKLVLEWVKEQGGAAAIAERNQRKAELLYGTIDRNSSVYTCPVDPSYRSHMNVVFRLPSEELEKQFVAEAAEAGMIGLKGHRSVGGIRASIYNAMPTEGVEKLTEFMQAFARVHG